MARARKTSSMRAKVPSYQKDRDRDASNESPQPRGTRFQQIHARADGHEIRCDVERVRHDENKEQKAHDPCAQSSEAVARQFSETSAGRERGSIAHLLHRGHERKSHEGRPEERHTVLGTSLSVRGDTRRIVVGSAGDESRPYRTQILEHSNPRIGGTPAIVS